MKRALSLLALMWLPIMALADGMVVHHVAVPAEVSIPDQRALICFSNGVERLVIETRFTGAGTNFAWIVPLPSQPAIEEATTGLFPTLQYLFQPRITHNVTRYYLGILFGVGFVVVAVKLHRMRNVWLDSLFFAFVLFVLAPALLLPTLSATRSRGSSSQSDNVSILERKIVGIFETVTLASTNANALEKWLNENNFAVPTNATPIIESYVKDGWIFAAAKVCRENSATATNTPHPLSFTFKTAKPVYPMRLTALNSDSLKVYLYVFADERARAKHFTVERCAKPEYPASSDRWQRAIPRSLTIVHPLLRQWTEGLPAATKLTATLSRRDMASDVQIDFEPYAEKTKEVFSYAGAATIGANWAAGVFAVALLIAWISSRKDGQRATFPKRISFVLLLSIGCGALCFLVLPKIKVTLVRHPGLSAEMNLMTVGDWMHRDAPTNFLQARAVLEGELAENSSSQDYLARRLAQNVWLGGQIRFEDSPGNFTLRDTTNEIEFIGYDSFGAAHVMNRLPR